MDTLPFEIGETAHALRRAFDRRAVTLGVTRAQWKVLFRLSRTPGLRQVELADMLDVEPITLSRIVDRLQDAGLVVRVADPADRRAWQLELTPKAQPLIGQLRQLGDVLVEEAFAGIPSKDLDLLRTTLERIRGNLCAAQTASKAAD